MFKNLAIAFAISVLMIGCGRVNNLKSNAIEGDNVARERDVLAEVKDKHINKYDNISTAIIRLNSGDKIEIVEANKAIRDFLEINFGITANPGSYIINLQINNNYKFDLVIFNIGDKFMGIILNKPVRKLNVLQ